MLVNSAVHTPEFMFPGDVVSLAPCLGSFSCCAREHNFGDGPNTAPCDLPNVASILSTMIDKKVSYLFECGRFFDARAVASLKHWFTRGAPSTVTIDRTDGLEEARQLFQWRGEEEEETETRRTGVDLLFFCALSDNLQAVEDLLARYPGIAASTAFFQGLRIDRPDLFTVFQAGASTLQSSAMFASWPVVEALLDAGADSMASTKNGFDVRCVYGGC